MRQRLRGKKTGAFGRYRVQKEKTGGGGYWEGVSFDNATGMAIGRVSRGTDPPQTRALRELDQI